MNRACVRAYARIVVCACVCACLCVGAYLLFLLLLLSRNSGGGGGGSWSMRIKTCFMYHPEIITTICFIQPERVFDNVGASIYMWQKRRGGGDGEKIARTHLNVSRRAQLCIRVVVVARYIHGRYRHY